MDYKPLLKTILQLLNFCGFNPLNEGLAAKFRSYLFTVCIFIVEIELCLGVFYYSVLENMLFNALAIFGVQILLFKCCFMALHKTKLRELIQIVCSSYWNTDKYGLKLKSEIDHIYKIMTTVTKIIATTLFIMILAHFLDPSKIKVQELPYMLYHFQGGSSTFKYLIGYAFELLTVHFLTISLHLGSDFLLVALIVYNLVELKLIKRGFLEIRDNSDMVKLKLLIDHHNLVFSCVDRINDAFSPMLLNLFLTNVFMSALGLLDILHNGFTASLSSVMAMALQMSMLFVFCFLGSLLTEESQSVADTIYQCGWWKKNQIELRKQFVLIIQRSHKTSKLMAGKMINLNLSSFTQVIRTTFSFFTLGRAFINQSN